MIYKYLGDIAEIKGGKRMPKGTRLQQEKNQHPYLRITDYDGKSFDRNSIRYVPDEVFEKISNYTVTEGDIFLSIVGTIGIATTIDKEYDNANLTENAVKIIPDESVNSKYILYFLQSMLGQRQMNELSVGSTQKKLPIKNIKKIKILLPNLEIQNKVVSNLQILDKKIALNNQINDNLLDFLDTEFSHQFLGERNFPSGKVKNFITIKRGASPRPIKDFLSENGRSWVKISDVTKLTTPFLYRTEQYIKESGIKKSRTIKPGTLILSNSATPGIPVISEILASVHDGWLIIDNYSLMDRNWFYLFFRQMRNSLVAQANGSVFNNLKTNIVKEFPVPIVDKSELTKFHKISNPIFEKLNQIQQENIELNRIKQTLLSQYF